MITVSDLLNGRALLKIYHTDTYIDYVRPISINVNKEDKTIDYYLPDGDIVSYSVLTKTYMMYGDDDSYEVAVEFVKGVEGINFLV